MSLSASYLKQMYVSKELPSASTPASIARKVFNGLPITTAERARLTPNLLALLALDGQIELTLQDRFRLSKSTLVQLATRGAITLSRRERDRLSPAVLAQLAVSGHVQLDADEYMRIPRTVRVLFGEKIRRA